MRLSEIALYINNQAEIVVDCEFNGVHLVGKRGDSANCLTYIESKKYIGTMLSNKVSGVICTRAIAEELRDKFGGGICVCDNPRKTFWEIHNYLTLEHRHKFNSKISSKAKIAKTAVIDEKNVEIEENVIIMDNAVIHDDVFIGKGSIIRENVVIGSPGYYYYGEGDEKKLVESAGKVIIGKNVEIHPNSVICKSVLGEATKIGDNTKIGALCSVGHDALIGSNCIITTKTSIAGGNVMGDNTFLGMSTTTAPNIDIASNSKTGVGTICAKSEEKSGLIINTKLYDNTVIPTKSDK